MTTPPAVTRLSLEEKVSLLAGQDMWSTASNARLGLPSIRVTDGPNGARGTGSLTGAVHSACFPAAIGLGATWDPALVAEIGASLAEQVRSKGASVLLAPTINLHRTALNGRNFECYSEDPYLSARLAVAYVSGVQARGVAATVKHFVGNEQEHQRMTISSDVSDRALRELYLVPFEAAVKEANVRCVMTAYNRVNGVYCCDHGPLVRDLLKGEWGFDGLVMSDWFGTRSTERALEAGLDLEMPGPTAFRGQALVTAVRARQGAETLVDESVMRLVNLAAWTGATTDPADETYLDRPEDRALIRRAGAAGMVLLRNNGILPLDRTRPQKVVVIGPNAKAAQIMGGGSAQLNALHRVSPWDGLVAGAGGNVELFYVQGSGNERLVPTLTGAVRLSFFDNEVLEGPPIRERDAPETDFFWFSKPFKNGQSRGFSVRAEMDFTPDRDGLYVFGLVSAGRARLIIDGVELIDGWTDWAAGDNYFGVASRERRADIVLDAGRSVRVTIEYTTAPGNPMGLSGFRAGAYLPMGTADIEAAVAAARAADVAIVCVGGSAEWDTEGRDRAGLSLPGAQDALVAAVADANPNTIVVLQTGGPVVTPWLENVAAVLQAWYPGQECGHAICDVLFGDAEPGGRLPQTFPTRLDDSSGFATYPGQNGVVRYEEGVFIGYRHHERHAIAPLFPFGFGLGYTTFEIGDLELISPPSSPYPRVSVTLTNTGARAGSEVVQLYVRDVAARVDRPDKELKRFAKVTLAPGERRTVTFDLDARCFAFFDEAAHAWVAEAGAFEILVGRNAADICAAVPFTLAVDDVIPVHPISFKPE